MNSNNRADKPYSVSTRPPLKATRIMAQLRERLRYLHYSLRTEEAYVHWVRFYIHFHGLRQPGRTGQRAQCEQTGHHRRGAAPTET